MFDVPLGPPGGPLSRKAREAFSVEVPSPSEDWRVGAIVGPSGSGKTTIAREAFGEALYEAQDWPEDRAVIDGFGDLPIKQITHTLTAVGFSSPPAWIKPYCVLSNGEKFRCDLARALLRPGEVVAFDEFTSVVDRTVGRIGSAAVAKAIRKGRIDKRFVAVTCHYDILEWLCPDWVVDMATCQLARGCLRRPEIALNLFRCGREAWRLFAKHHYLSGGLNPSAQCYLAEWDGRPVCFVAVLPMIGRKNRRRISRIVTLPDYQGVGIARAMLDAVAGLYRDMGRRMNITTSHPAMIRSLTDSASWRTVGVAKLGRSGGELFTGGRKPAFISRGRAVASFEYAAV